MAFIVLSADFRHYVDCFVSQGLAQWCDRWSDPWPHCHRQMVPAQTEAHHWDGAAPGSV